MAKSRSAKPGEELLGELRALRKENKSLKQRLKRLEKREHLVEDALPPQDEEISRDTEDTMHYSAPRRIKCQESDCGKGIYQEFELMNKIYGTCTVCNHRKRLK